MKRFISSVLVLFMLVGSMPSYAGGSTTAVQETPKMVQLSQRESRELARLEQASQGAAEVKAGELNEVAIIAVTVVAVGALVYLANQ